MNISDLTTALQRDATSVVFVNVLLQQMGLPVPAVPTLMLAGSLMLSLESGAWVLAAAVVASIIADTVWYAAGRAFGYRVLSGLCRLSLNPASCVSSSESLFVRWGALTLVVAKFVPGLSIVGPPIAGSLRLSPSRFLAAAAAGAALWAASALLAGWLLRAQLTWVLAVIDANSTAAMAVAALLVGTWLGWKLWQRRRFRQWADIPYISRLELEAALMSSSPPLVIDLRGPASVAAEGKLDTAVPAQMSSLLQVVASWPKDAPIVTLCACPQDATAVLAARALTKEGFLSVRPLRGSHLAA
jgi:membrane protein DedA with SNARE-associated domain/rhodanese-related sulfurtransferase